MITSKDLRFALALSLFVRGTRGHGRVVRSAKPGNRMVECPGGLPVGDGLVDGARLIGHCDLPVEAQTAATRVPEVSE